MSQDSVTIEDISEVSLQTEKPFLPLMYSSVGTLGGEWRGLSIPMARLDGREVAKDYHGKCIFDNLTMLILLRMTVSE